MAAAPGGAAGVVGAPGADAARPAMEGDASPNSPAACFKRLWGGP